MRDHVINQIAFTADDLQLIKYTAFAQWPRDGFAKSEDFDAWLETTPINPTLRPHLWGLIGAHYPNRFFANWDLVGVFDCLQIRPGLILETRWSIRDANPTPKAIGDALARMLERASAEIRISSVICVLLLHDTSNATEQMWVCAEGLQNDERLGLAVHCRVTFVMVSAAQKGSLFLWSTV
jgi:hypothetical protein